MLPFRRTMAVLVLLPLLIVSVPRVQSAEQEKLTHRLSLLTGRALQVHDADKRAEALSLPSSGPGSLLTSNAGELLVYIRLTVSNDDVLARLRAAGTRILHIAPAYHTVTAYVYPTNISMIAALQEVVSIREEYQPVQLSAIGTTQSLVPATIPAQVACTGAATSEGDRQLRADQARETFGLDGNGVTVGILSDTYDAASMPTNARDDITSGDLPGLTNPCGRVAPVNVIDEGSGPRVADEGRAMAQIVHDLAPGAHLAFATAFDGQFLFADNIRALRQDAGADIIVDDIFYFAEPFFQEGPVGSAIQDVTDAGALYFTAAGNGHIVDSAGHALGSYQADGYRPTACPNIRGTANNRRVVYDCHDFNPGAEDDATMGITLQPGGEFQISFQWAQPWFGVTTDFDLYLLDSSGRVLQSGMDTNTTLSGIPFETLFFQNESSMPETVNLVIARQAGIAVPRLKFVVVRDQGLSAFEYTEATSADTFGPTVFGHSSSPAAISVGAVPYDDATTPEPFSSHGFAIHYFAPVRGDRPAAPLPVPPVLRKPDLAATDGGQNTFFGRFVNGTYRFYGTSAAAPHAAAVAALLIERAHQRNMSLNQERVEMLLETTAVQVANGNATVTGAGLIDAVGAVEAVGRLTFDTYLPSVTVAGTPDLVATVKLVPDKAQFTAGEPVEIVVDITNQGSAAAPPFWVDLLINPGRQPATNIIWNEACTLDPCYGIAWGVVSGLKPDERITLTSKHGQFAAPYSRWPGYFAAGTTDLFVFADSWNPDTASGAVLELDEANNSAAIHNLAVVGSNQPGMSLMALPVIPERPVLTNQ
jgi:subtilisin family serine protease